MRRRSVRSLALPGTAIFGIGGILIFLLTIVLSVVAGSSSEVFACVVLLLGLFVSVTTYGIGVLIDAINCHTQAVMACAELRSESKDSPPQG